MSLFTLCYFYFIHVYAIYCIQCLNHLQWRSVNIYIFLFLLSPNSTNTFILINQFIYFPPCFSWDQSSHSSTVWTEWLKGLHLLMNDCSFTTFSSHTSDRCTGSTFKTPSQISAPDRFPKPASIKGLVSFWCVCVWTLDIIGACHFSCLERQGFQNIEKQPEFWESEIPAWSLLFTLTNAWWSWTLIDMIVEENHVYYYCGRGNQFHMHR